MARSRAGRGLGRARVTQVFPRAMVGAVVDSNMSTGLAEFARGVRTRVLRGGVHAGAIVFYNEMRVRVPVREGTLFGSIYRWHDDKHSNSVRQVYVVGPNKAKAPHWYNVEYGHWLYNKNIAGRWQRSKSNANARGPGAHDLPGALPTPVWVPAKPYIRPTFDAKAQAAIDAMRSRMGELLRELMSGNLPA